MARSKTGDRAIVGNDELLTKGVVSIDEWALARQRLIDLLSVASK